MPIVIAVSTVTSLVMVIPPLMSHIVPVLRRRQRKFLASAYDQRAAHAGAAVRFPVPFLPAVVLARRAGGPAGDASRSARCARDRRARSRCARNDRDGAVR